MDQPTWKTMELKRLREAYENAKRNYYGKQYVERREKEEQGEGTMTQCVAMAMKPYYSTNPLAASFALRNGYQRGQVMTYQLTPLARLRVPTLGEPRRQMPKRLLLLPLGSCFVGCIGRSN